MILVLQSPRLGDIVWGKFGRKLWWPAIVVLGKMASMKPADKGSSWIFWFGDHKISQVNCVGYNPRIYRMCHAFYDQGLKSHQTDQLS